MEILILALLAEGEQNIPPQNMLLGHTDHPE